MNEKTEVSYRVEYERNPNEWLQRGTAQLDLKDAKNDLFWFREELPRADFRLVEITTTITEKVLDV